MPFDAYRCYLSLKNHFTKDHYDYHRYGGKTRATKEAFYKRKDRFWFERFSRQKNDKEVVDFFVSNFVSCSDPESMWIGEMIRDGEGRYVDWKKKVQSLSYVFKEECRGCPRKGVRMQIDQFDSTVGQAHPAMYNRAFRN